MTDFSAEPVVTASAAAPKLLRLIAITRKPDSASFEQRVTHYIPHLQNMGIEVETRTLPSSLRGQWKLMNEVGSCEPSKNGGQPRPKFDGVWWHRHMLSGIMRHKLHKQARPIVFDFDDPLPFSSQTNAISASRNRRFASFLKICTACLPASEYLRDLALPYCSNAPIVPMGIDLPQTHVLRANGTGGSGGSGEDASSEMVELLWLGGKSTQVYLEALREPLEQLAIARPGRVKLRLVAHEPMTFGSLQVDFRNWSFEEQEQSLRECHVGLCPMPQTPWTQGKCPFKVLQYMAYGLPWVGSAVGANLVSAGDPQNEFARGLCADSNQQWLARLLELVDHPAQRLAMGDAGRAYAAIAHERGALAQKLAVIFRQACR